MNIVTAANNVYACHLKVMLKSILFNISKTEDLHIYVLHSDLLIEEVRNIEGLVRGFGAEISFYRVDNDYIKSLKMNQHLSYISRETFYRIEIPNLLPLHVEKVLYLDCDIIVLDDLLEVWETDIEEYYVAAVVDFASIWEGEKLIIPPDYSYFNAGFLLMNIKKWRADEISDKVKEVLIEYGDRLKYMDQDALNFVLHKNYLSLDLKWNYQTYFWKYKMLSHPSVIHFTGPEKPWTSSTDYTYLYYEYLNRLD